MLTHRPGIIPVLAIAFLSLGTGISQTPSNSVQTDSGPKAGLPYVLTATVTDDKGGFASGLKKTNFQAFVGKEPATVVELSDVDEPTAIGLLFDVSASVVGRRSDKSIHEMAVTFREAVSRIHALRNKSTEYFLVAFNGAPQLLLDWTSDSDPMAHSLQPFASHKGTALYDACYLGIEKLQRGKYAKRALIVVSDGEDTNSHYNYRQLREALRDSNVLLYSVNLTEEQLMRSGATEGEKILKELSSISGGKSFRKEEKLKLYLPSVFEAIATELSHQYLVSIRPQSSTIDADWHKVKFTLKPSDDAEVNVRKLKVRTREGIYLKP